MSGKIINFRDARFARAGRAGWGERQGFSAGREAMRGQSGSDRDVAGIAGAQSRPDYKNWVPETMVLRYSLEMSAFSIASFLLERENHPRAAACTRLLEFFCGAASLWCCYARSQFAYDGQRKLSKQIVEGVSSYLRLPEGGRGLDIGCGSGALTIACAKRNPQGSMVGVDLWGAKYALSFSKELCEQNAAAEGVGNVCFQKGNAVKLPFPDESFDAVTSNYVYHNIRSADRQALLRESLRVLKKGGVFAIHDLMGPARYGNMDAFVASLHDEGYEEVRRIRTAEGKFMSKAEARLLMLGDSTLLFGRK